MTRPAPRTSDLRIRYRTIHGHRRAYRLAGSGPPVLLLHGIGDHSGSWLGVMKELARDHTVLAPDLLGHGASDKPRADYSVAAYANGMRDLMEVLGIDRATIVGHSLGGGVAAQLSYQFPDRCERLVLVATGGVGREVSPILRVAAAPLAEFVLPVMKWPLGRLAGRLAVGLLRLTPTDLAVDADEVHRIFEQMPDGQARGAFTRTLRSVVDERGQVVTMLDRTYLAREVPVLLVWGDRDAIIPVAHGHRAHEALPGSRLSVVEGAGHFPHHFDEERFVAEFREFMATTKPARHDPRRFRRLLRSGRPHVPAEAQPVDESLAG